MTDMPLPASQADLVAQVKGARATIVPFVEPAPPASPTTTATGHERHAAKAVNEKDRRMARLARLRFDPARPAREEVPAFWLGTTVVATEGNLVQIVAAVKSGKSAFMSGACAAAWGSPSAMDTLGWRANNTKGRAVIHIDTEQSPAHFDKFNARVQRRSGLTDYPDYYQSYHCTGLKASDVREVLDDAVSYALETTGGIYCIIIDGIGDALESVNDEEAAQALLAHIHSIAINHSAVVFLVIHRNPNDKTGKGRGHLGSFGERKGEANLIIDIDRDSGISTVYGPANRNAPIHKSDGQCFHWSEDAKMHVSVPNPKSKRTTAAALAATFGDVCTVLRASGIALTGEQLVAELKRNGKAISYSALMKMLVSDDARDGITSEGLRPKLFRAK